MRSVVHRELRYTSFDGALRWCARQDDGVGGVILSVKPYIMDLETTNGTYLNGDKIDDQRYYEVIAKQLCCFSLAE